MPTNSEVDGILEAIRAEVRKIKANGDHTPRPTGPGLKSKVQSFRLSRGGHVRAGRILRYRGEDFIRQAYLALLNRQPDAEGLLHWLKLLRDDGYSRITILRMISESREGRIHKVPIRGLKIRSAGGRLADGFRAIPLLGRLRIPRRRPGKDADPEQSLETGDSSDRFIEEMRGRLRSIEERLDRLDRLVREGRENRGRREPGDPPPGGAGPRP